MEVKQTEGKLLVLFVGEGDFSYSASYVEKTNTATELVLATCLSSGILNTTQKNNIKLIESCGGFVLTDVDATQLDTHPVLGTLSFSKVVFNFPHVPKKMNIRENRKLVELFLKSAAKVLSPDGRILVALCAGQGGTEAEHHVRIWGNSWQIVELASQSGLLLCNIKPFDADNFEKYNCTGFRGLSKSFRTEAAVTHVFARGSPFPLPLQTPVHASRDELLEWFHSHNRDLYELLSQRLHCPYSRIVDDISESLKSTDPTVNFIFVENLLTCNVSSLHTISLASSTEMTDFEKSTFCSNCLNKLLSMYLKSPNNGMVNTSIIFCVSCEKCIDMCQPPFLHMLSYFCVNEESLMDGVESFLNSLKKSANPKKVPKFDSWTDINNYSNQTIKKEDHIPISHEITIEELNTIQASYCKQKSNCFMFYTDIDIVISNDGDFVNNAESSFKIGHIIKFTCNTKTYFAALLNLELICALRYHVFDYRTFFQIDSYFTTELFQEMPLLVLCSPSLFPPTYTHDISFWVGTSFEEKHLFLLAKRTLGLIVKSIRLIDLHYDEISNKEGRCYRFVYQSTGEVLSKFAVANIHSQIRRIIENSLKVCLR